MIEQDVAGFRISPQQRALWPWQRDSASFCSQAAVRITGRFDFETLEAAVRAVVERHEILRTSFHAPAGAGLPIQVIHETATAACERRDVATDSNHEAVLEAVLKEHRKTMFESDRGSLLQLSWLPQSSAKSDLLVTLPAVCGDIWALKNLLRELASLCSAPPALEEADEELLQYADVAAWLNDQAEDDDEEARQYWRHQAASVPRWRLLCEQPTALGVDFSPRRVPLGLSSTELNQAATSAAEFGASLESFLLTCWQVLLARIAGRSELVLGCRSDGRHHEPLRTGLGLLETYLPLRSRITGKEQLAQMLPRNDAAQAANREWQELFDWDLILAAQGGTTAREQFFPYAFEFESQPSRWHAGNSTWTLHRQFSCTAPFGLKLACSSMADQPEVQLDYDPRRFAAEDVRALAHQLKTLCRRAVADPEATTGSLTLSNPSQRHWLSLARNDTMRNFGRPTAIHQLFETWAEHSPKAPAVRFEDRVWNYDSLNRRANQLARELSDHGIGSETPVALCLQRSEDLAVAVLAVWKAGGFYIPLDPEAPRKRLARLLEGIAPRLVVVHEQFLDLLPVAGPEVLCLEQASPRIAAQPDMDLKRSVTPDQLAYVVHTSGSTGAPKPIATSHRNAFNYLSFVTEAYELSPRDVVLQLASLSFDASVRDLFGPLTSGASAVIVGALNAITPDALLTQLNARGITCVLSIVPTLLRELLAAAGRAETAEAGDIYPDLRLVLASGEVLHQRDGTEVHRRLGPHVRLINQYGPTECTMTSTWWPMPARTADERPAALGDPIANTRIYLLDREAQLTPAGAAGEICIAGAGLARGYFGRPSWTAQAFLPNPWNDRSGDCQIGSRLYRTGDLARWQLTGQLEFLGRSDQQVKIHGVRIELGEIEGALRQIPAVRAAAVIARSDPSATRSPAHEAFGPDRLRLVAYIVPQERAIPAETELRELLQHHLPIYMLPAIFVSLKALPLTASGKVDRAALPDPSQSQAPYIAPRTPTEQTLVDIWRETLELDRVGVKDNFFAIGGHSLLATQVAARIHAAFGLELGLPALFRAPTIAELAELVVEEEMHQVGAREVEELLRQVETMAKVSSDNSTEER